MRLILILAFFYSIGFPTAGAKDRVALLIANHDTKGGSLPGAKASVEAVALELKDLGFQVRIQENLSTKEIESAFRDLAVSIPTNGTTVIYFAGFGGQHKVEGENVPDRWVTAIHAIDAEKDTNTIRKRSVTLEKMREWMVNTSGARTTCLFLDCRKNPGQTETIPPGLADVGELEFLDGAMIGFAAPPGEAATGAGSGPSPFSTAVIQALKSGDPNRLPWHRVIPTAHGDVVALPGKPDRQFLDSESVQEGEFAGQEWLSPFGVIFCWCPAGDFTMGDPVFDDAEPVKVKMTRGYWIMKYEYTQRERQLINNRGPQPNVMFQHRLAPVVQMKYNDAFNTPKKLTESERKAGRLPEGWAYALPTEAEWEYACRAGSEGAFCFGDSPDGLDRFGNFADLRLLADDDTFHWSSTKHDDGAGRRFTLAGSYRPNAWGIHDMHGNVNEWTADLYLPELTGGVDPRPPDRHKDFSDKVFRGGAWCSPVDYCRSGFRNFASASNNSQTDQHTGLRFVLKRIDTP